MTLKTGMAADADAVFLDTDQFAESVTYTPLGGSARSIKAIVNRDPPAGIDEVPDGRAAVLVLTVENDSTRGIASDEIDTGGDTITVSRRSGEAASAREIVRIVSHDDYFVTIELRAGQ